MNSKNEEACQKHANQTENQNRSKTLISSTLGPERHLAAGEPRWNRHGSARHCNKCGGDKHIFLGYSKMLHNCVPYFFSEMKQIVPSLQFGKKTILIVTAQSWGRSSFVAPGYSPVPQKSPVLKCENFICCKQIQYLLSYICIWNRMHVCLQLRMALPHFLLDWHAAMRTAKRREVHHSRAKVRFKDAAVVAVNNVFPQMCCMLPDFPKVRCNSHRHAVQLFD